MQPMNQYNTDPPIEPTETGQERAKKTTKKLDIEKIEKCLFELYENLNWSMNEINKINTYLNSLRTPQQQPVFYQEPEPQYVPPVNPSEPTFTKRTAPLTPMTQEPEKPTKKSWYKQKGVIAAIILVVLAMYMIYLFIMKSQGHTISIPGLGKF